MGPKHFSIAYNEQKSVHFRFRYKLQGAHVHARLWVASSYSRDFIPEELVEHTHSSSGLLVFNIQEWEAFRSRMEERDLGGPHLTSPTSVVEFIDESEDKE